MPADIPAAELATTARALASSRGGEAAQLRRRLAASFTAELPELMQQGLAVQTALRMPLGEGAETAVKRLLLILARRLREGGEATPPPSELAHMPRLFQRLRLEDHQLFEDFCVACGMSWTALNQRELTELLKGAEDYVLLHATQGRALTRLAAALNEGLKSGDASDSAVAALCHAVLAVRSRSSCAALLDTLAAKVGAATQPGAASPALAHAAAELDAAAVALPAGSLQSLLGAAQSTLEQQAVGEAELLSVLRACARSHMLEADAVAKLFAAALPHLKKSTGDSRDSLLAAAKHLPGRLRLQLAREVLLPEAAGSLEPRAAKVRVELLHDLAGLSEDAEEQKQLAKATESAVSALLGASEPHTSALAWAYLGSSSAAHALDGVSESQELAQLTQRALDGLKGRWQELSPMDVQVLLRSPGGASDLSSQLSKHFGDLGSLRVQISALGADVKDVNANSEQLLASVKKSKSAKELFAAEGALRRAVPASSPAGEAVKAVLAAVRERAFRAFGKMEAARNSRPPRGYILHVQERLQRDRRRELDKAAATDVDDTEVHEPVSASPVVEEAREVLPEVREPEYPESGVPGVKWHRGVGGWEVRVEVAGRPRLGGYFKPQEDAVDKEAAIQEALTTAIRRHASF